MEHTRGNIFKDHVRKEGNIFEAQIKLDIGNLVKEMLKIKLGMH